MLFAFHRASTNVLQLFYSVYDSTSGPWQPDTQVPNVEMTESPSAVVYDRNLYVFYQGFDDESGPVWMSMTRS